MGFGMLVVLILVMKSGGQQHRLREAGTLLLVSLLPAGMFAISAFCEGCGQKSCPSRRLVFLFLVGT